MVTLGTDTLARSISQLFYTSFLIFFLSVKSKKKTYHLTGSIITDFHVSCSLLCSQQLIFNLLLFVIVFRN